MGLVKPGTTAEAARAGRMRHGLWTKYVDACQASRALAGDYSPRTGRSLPKHAALCKSERWPSAAFGAVDAKAVRVDEGFAGPQMGLDQRWIFEEGVSYQA